MKVYAKFIVAAVVAGLIALQTALSDDSVTNSEWITIALAVVGALAVYAVPNALASPPAEKP